MMPVHVLKKTGYVPWANLSTGATGNQWPVTGRDRMDCSNARAVLG